jgi:hypothetical protein
MLLVEFRRPNCSKPGLIARIWRQIGDIHLLRENTDFLRPKVKVD